MRNPKMKNPAPGPRGVSENDLLVGSVVSENKTHRTLAQERSEYLLSEMRCAALRARDVVYEIDAICGAYKIGLISGDTAIQLLHESGAPLLIKGDLSDGHKKFREGLAKLELDAPNGKIKLDQNRQAVGTNFITEVVELPNGDLVNKAMKVIPDVKQTLGFTPEQFAKLGLPSRTNPECKKSYN